MKATRRTFLAAGAAAAEAGLHAQSEGHQHEHQAVHPIVLLGNLVSAGHCLCSAPGTLSGRGGSRLGARAERSMPYGEATFDKETFGISRSGAQHRILLQRQDRFLARRSYAARRSYR